MEVSTCLIDICVLTYLVLISSSSKHAISGTRHKERYVRAFLSYNWQFCIEIMSCHIVITNFHERKQKIILSKTCTVEKINT